MQAVTSSFENYAAGLWVHFSKLPQLTINPKQFHQDPAGLYLFPEKFKTEGNWHRFPYRIVCRLRPGLRVLDVPKLTHPEVLGLLDAFGFQDMRGDEYLAEDKNFRDRFWDIIRQRFRGEPGRFNKAWRRQGYDAIFDDQGIIHPAEIQLIVLNPRFVEVVRIEEQKNSGFDEINRVLDLMASRYGSLGEITIRRPTQQRDWGEKQLRGSIEIKSGDNYATFNVDPWFVEKTDQIPEAISVRLAADSKGLKSKWSWGLTLKFRDFDRELHRLTDPKEDVARALQQVFSEGTVSELLPVTVPMAPDFADSSDAYIGPPFGGMEWQTHPMYLDPEMFLHAPSQPAQRFMKDLIPLLSAFAGTPEVETRDGEMHVEIEGKGEATGQLYSADGMGWWFEKSEDEMEDFPYGEIAILEHVSIEPKLRREGIGTQLVRTFCQAAKRYGAEAVFLNASPFGSEAGGGRLTIGQIVSFYKSMGFKTWQDQGNSQVMWLELKNKQSTASTTYTADDLINSWGEQNGEKDLARRFRKTGYDFNSRVPHVIDRYETYRETMADPKDIQPNGVKSWYEPMHPSEEEYAQDYASMSPKTAPPVILHPNHVKSFKWKLVDGRHRTRAAALKGDKVRAVIPIGEMKAQSDFTREDTSGFYPEGWHDDKAKDPVRLAPDPWIETVPEAIRGTTIKEKMTLKNLDNFPGYSAGSDGHIYSFRKSGWGMLGVTNENPKRLKASLDGRGKYTHVTLRKDGRYFTRSVHSLVCEAFHGARPENMEVSHLDGNRGNNKPDNLLWETRSQNHKRKIEHGTDDCGVRNSRAMFNENQIYQIRKWIAEGIKLRTIAQKMNCNERAIGKIKRGERYARDPVSRQPNMKIFLDLDGVLSDFDQMFRDHAGKLPREVDSKELWGTIDRIQDFWTGMDWMPDGPELWNFLKSYNPTILSAPSRSPLCIPGKKQWLEDHIGQVPAIFEQKKEKYAEPGAVLIDDRPDNIEKWRRAGGIGILHTSAPDTIRQLKEILAAPPPVEAGTLKKLPDIPVQEKEFEGLRITNTRLNKFGEFSVEVYDELLNEAEQNKLPVAGVTFSVGTDGFLHPPENREGLKVSEPYRRRGIATEMYKFAEEVSGLKVKPAKKQTEDAEKFWAQPKRSFGAGKKAMKLYHGTNRDRLKRIETEGLDPLAPKASQGEDYIYLTDKPEIAAMFSGRGQDQMGMMREGYSAPQSAKKQNGVILEVKVDPKFLDADPDQTEVLRDTADEKKLIKKEYQEILEDMDNPTLRFEVENKAYELAKGLHNEDDSEMSDEDINDFLEPDDQTWADATEIIAMNYAKKAARGKIKEAELYRAGKMFRYEKPIPPEDIVKVEPAAPYLKGVKKYFGTEYAQGAFDLAPRRRTALAGAKGDWKKEGYKIRGQGNPEDVGRGQDWIVNAYDKTGKEVAQLRVYDMGSQIAASDIRVEPEHRRKGLASAMYRYAEKATGKKMAPASEFSDDENDMTEDAHKFWAQPKRSFGGQRGDWESEGGFWFKTKNDTDGMWSVSVYNPAKKVDLNSEEAQDTINHYRNKDGMSPKDAREQYLELYSDPEHGGLVGFLQMNLEKKEESPYVKGFPTEPGQAYNVWVDEQYRRKGLASAMYRKFERDTGIKPIPSPTIKPEGQKLWEGMRRIASGARGDWKAEGYTLTCHVETGQLGLLHVQVWAKDKNGKTVGNLGAVQNWADKSATVPDKTMTASAVIVNPQHQRKGLASAMYRLAEKETGLKFKQDNGGQSKEGQKLWKQPNRSFGAAETKARRAEAKATIPEDSELMQFYNQADRQAWAEEVQEEAYREWDELTEQDRLEQIPYIKGHGNWRDLPDHPKTAAEWDELKSHFAMMRESDAMEDAPTSQTFFENAKLVRNPTLVRFTDHPGKLLNPDGTVNQGVTFEGHGPDNLGLTVHGQRPGSGDLAFAFNIKELKTPRDWESAKGKYGEYIFKFKVPYAVEADHISDGERQTVFDVTTVGDVQLVEIPKRTSKQQIQEWLDDIPSMSFYEMQKLREQIDSKDYPDSLYRAFEKRRKEINREEKRREKEYKALDRRMAERTERMRREGTA